MGDEDNRKVNISRVISNKDEKKRPSHKVQISWGERREQLILTRLVEEGALGLDSEAEI